MNESDQSRPPRGPESHLTRNQAPARSWRAVLVGGALVAPLFVVATALAIPVHGTLRVPRAPASDATEGARDHYWRAPNGQIDPGPAPLDAARETTVVLTGSVGPSNDGCRYRVAGGDLMPRTLVVKVGEAAGLTNSDPTHHNIHTEGSDTLPPTVIGPGRAREIRIGEAGSWPLRDELYRHVSGHLVAIPDLVACASVSHQGAWRFEDIPAGEYTLKVFFEGREAHSQSVSVGTRGDVRIDPITLSRQ